MILDDVRPDTVQGDELGLAFPTHPQAFLAAGAQWLTHAFRSFGSIAADNAVTRIVSVRPCPGGSAGAKLMIEVAYAKADPGLHRHLFVKFSRDFADQRRDRQRFEMLSEARFARYSRFEGFPVRVPAAYFAEFERASGTGLIVTEAIPFGVGEIEPHRRKCMDHLTLADAPGHYRTVLTALATLGGAHKAGILPREIEAGLPYDPATATADPIAFDRAKLEEMLAFNTAFARACPQLLPAPMGTPEFLERMCHSARRIMANEAAIRDFLLSNRDMCALMHWNAHIDNCWFWRDQSEALHCGMIDWGRVGQITLPTAIWGSLAAAPLELWDSDLDALLAAFLDRYTTVSGARIGLDELKMHLALHLGLIGVSRVLALPEVVMFRLPECVIAQDRLDPMFHDCDPARNSLHLYVTCLSHWQRSDLAGLLDRLGLHLVE